MIGRVLKIFSDFYYVQTDYGLVESKLRSVLKKQKQDIFTGDYVELVQFDSNSMQAFIEKIVKRKNLITKPKAANISQVIIVSALKEPNINFEQLNRFILFSEYNNIKPVLCFNKEDVDDNDLIRQKVLEIYKPLNYEILFTSALNKTGINELKPILLNNTSILSGASGVGKSSLINALLNSSILRTLPVSDKTKKGVHTTRHCELLQIDKDSYVVDTPGFSHLKFDFLLPEKIQNNFTEFKNIESQCKFKNCLHIGELGCSFQSIIECMHPTRYESYKKFVAEAKEYQEKISKESTKQEKTVKYNQNKIMTKISHKKRNLNRKTANQKMYKDEI